MRAGNLEETSAHRALEGLCQDYWRPLFHFARRKGHSPEDAQDLTQGFISKLLETNSFSRADRERGRFRTFLLSAFCHFIATHRRDQAALKRGGGFVMVSLNNRDSEATDFFSTQERMTPELEYERSWALALLDRALGRLRGEYLEAGRSRLFEAMEPHLSGAAGRPGYAKLGTDLGMSESAVTVAMHRMRRRYGELVREEIAETVTTRAEVDDELRHLMGVVSGARAHR